jgi:metal-responsive CopG/Arc/MetJ family transcriptional regulator
VHALPYREKKLILFYMKQLIVELDHRLAQRLERVAPGRARKRSDFVRAAIAEALDRALEDETRKAYERSPDTNHEYFDEAVWEPRPTKRRGR